MRIEMNALLKFCAPLLLAVCVFPLHAEETSELPEPHQVVDDVTRQVIALIRDTQTREQVDVQAFKADIYELLNPRLDWVGFSRGVMGQHFQAATEVQRTGFVESVRVMLLDFYAAAMLRLQDQEIRVLMPKAPPSNLNRVNVNLEFVGSDGQAIPIVFYMRRTSEGAEWKLVNINLAGINLGLTWRNQFGRIMDVTGDIDQAIIEFAAAVIAASPQR